jgi:hypothetical protein
LNGLGFEPFFIIAYTYLALSRRGLTGFFSDYKAKGNLKNLVREESNYLASVGNRN